ncbi:protein Flattop homolog [Nematostella vectensis]|uniref:protein Flattop homolog n=1 Tax=Nematostella vectensis TaxID=45351 RepID=UPI002077594A|nr:protein Flattop homolog [Nematostella vectensis]
MSTHFSANQYEKSFDAKRLQNWEVPKHFKEHPSSLEGFTQIISNDRGHILEGIPRSSRSPWGEFVGTWDMTKPPLRTKTLKTKAMTENAQQKRKSASPKQEVARTPSPAKASPRRDSPVQASPRNASPLQGSPKKASAEKVRTPSPKAASVSPVANKSPSPKLATPEPC